DLLQTQGIFGGLRRGGLLARFFVQQAHRRQIVFHFLKSAQHRLPVTGHRRVVGRARAAIQRGVAPEIQNRFSRRSAQRPETVRPAQPVRQAPAFIAARRGERKRREKSDARQPPRFVGGGHLALGGSDIGTPLEKLGGHAGGNHRRPPLDPAHRQRK